MKALPPQPAHWPQMSSAEFAASRAKMHARIYPAFRSALLPPRKQAAMLASPAQSPLPALWARQARRRARRRRGRWSR
jgi:hypothetical protein